MKIIKDVQSSNKSFTQLEFNVDTIYIRSNERKWYDEETREHVGWIYDEIQMSYNQFMEEHSKQVTEDMENLSDMQFESQLNEFDREADLEMLSDLVFELQFGGR